VKDRGIVAFEVFSFSCLKHTLLFEIGKKSFLTKNFKGEIDLLSRLLDLK